MLLPALLKAQLSEYHLKGNITHELAEGWVTSVSKQKNAEPKTRPFEFTALNVINK